MYFTYSTCVQPDNLFHRWTASARLLGQRQLFDLSGLFLKEKGQDLTDFKGGKLVAGHGFFTMFVYKTLQHHLESMELLINLVFLLISWCDILCCCHALLKT